jgi:hypothetical protein
MTTTKAPLTIVKAKIYFNQFKVHHYSDGTYRFENYAPRFTDLMECLTWGRAYQEAEKTVQRGQEQVAKLQSETADLLKSQGLLWSN